MRPELEEWIKHLQEPNFKNVKGYWLNEGIFSFSNPGALMLRVDAILQIGKLYEENSQKINEILNQHQISVAIPMKYESSHSLIASLPPKLRAARNKTAQLAALIPAWSDLVSKPEVALSRIQRENSDLMLVQIAMNLDQEPLADKIWDVLAKKVISKNQNAETRDLSRSIFGIDTYMVGVKFLLHLLNNYAYEMGRNPELLSIFLEINGYRIIDGIYQLKQRLDELSTTRGEPWTNLKSVVSDAQKAQSSNEESAQNFRARLELKAPSRACSEIFIGGN